MLVQKKSGNLLNTPLIYINIYAYMSACVCVPTRIYKHIYAYVCIFMVCNTRTGISSSQPNQEKNDQES